MTTSNIEKRIRDTARSSEENFILEPDEGEGAGDWQGADVLNREIQDLVDRLPNEHQIELFIDSLRTSDLRDEFNSLLIDVISAIKDPNLYRLSCLYALNNWFSKTSEIVTHKTISKSMVFKKQADTWHKETDHLSSPQLITSHEAYLKIISMGASVIPFILQDLHKRGGNWYVALRMLSDQDPVPPEAQGNIPLMKESWLIWGRENGYIE